MARTNLVVRQCPFDPFAWYWQLPRSIRGWIPPWPVTGAIGTISAHWLHDPWLSQMITIYWLVMLFHWGIEHGLKRWLSRYPWAIALFYGPVAFSYAQPAYAQASGSCSGAGLFGEIATFAFTLLSTLQLTGSVTGATLSDFVCSFVGIMFLGTVIAFVGGAGFVGYQLSTGAPFSVVVQPLVGVISFVILVTIIITLLIGTGT